MRIINETHKTITREIATSSDVLEMQHKKDKNNKQRGKISRNLNKQNVMQSSRQQFLNGQLK